MNWKGFFLIALAISAVAVLLFGFGSCVHRDMTRDDARESERLRQEADYRRACLRAEKTMIGDSCVKLAP